VHDRPVHSERKAARAGGRPKRSGVRIGRGAALAMLAAAAVSPAALAQHATAFDVEDGARAYDASCANCHGPDGDLIAGIDFGRGVYRRALSDDEIVGIVINGIPNTPMPPTPGMSEAQARQVVAYLRAMPDARSDAAAIGDPERGQALFEGKGECLDCHRVDGRGARVGPNLSRIGQLRRAAELEQSLLDPQAEILPENRFYTVAPKEGDPITGRLLNHDTYTVQILGPDERLRSFRKAELLEHGFAESPMPAYRDRLTEQEIADLVSYLATLNDGASR
jgi:putative heme-binding domain-containing protein